MATLLEKYQNMKSDLMAESEKRLLNETEQLQFQEIVYRVSVLETLMRYTTNMPVTTDKNVLVMHFRPLNALVRSLPYERRFGLPGDQKVEAQRTTATTSLMEAMESYLSFFQGYQPGDDTQYREDIKSMINALIPIWLQFRSSYVQI